MLSAYNKLVPARSRARLNSYGAQYARKRDEQSGKRAVARANTDAVYIYNGAQCAAAPTCARGALAGEYPYRQKRAQVSGRKERIGTRRLAIGKLRGAASSEISVASLTSASGWHPRFSSPNVCEIIVIIGVNVGQSGRSGLRRMQMPFCQLSASDRFWRDWNKTRNRVPFGTLIFRRTAISIDPSRSYRDSSASRSVEYRKFRTHTASSIVLEPRVPQMLRVPEYFCSSSVG
jgi:hypothetical protein